MPVMMLYVFALSFNILRMLFSISHTKCFVFYAFSVWRRIGIHCCDDYSCALFFRWLSLTPLSRLTFFAAFVYIAIIVLTDVEPFKQFKQTSEIKFI